MARELKKPSVIKESDLKEYDGPVEIDVSPRKAAEKIADRKEAESKKLDALASARAAAAAVASQPEVSTVKTISFGAWFQKATTKNPKLKLSYKEALEAHCRSIGISNSASEEEFDAALSHFGL